MAGIKSSCAEKATSVCGLLWVLANQQFNMGQVFPGSYLGCNCNPTTAGNQVLKPGDQGATQQENLRDEINTKQEMEAIDE